MVGFKEELKLKKSGYKRIAGVDEAGRGPLAGPVVACAVVVKKFNFKKADIEKIKDSKKLTAKEREFYYSLFKRSSCMQWGIGKVSAKVIDKKNILRSAELAMERAVAALSRNSLNPDFLIIDGNRLQNQNLKTRNYKLVVKADGKIFSCICAGIIAKVTRDRIMGNYHKKYPLYGFNRHKGYPTKEHKKMIKKHGLLIIHRRSFSFS